MIRLPAFELTTAASVREAVNLLTSEHRATVLAGGTDLIARMKEGTAAPKHVVSLEKLPELREITPMPNGGLRVGAMATLGSIASSPLVAERVPSLVYAAKSVASPAIRNRATLGGNLCLDTRCSYFDQSEFWRMSLGGCLKGEVGGCGSPVCHAAPGWKKCSAAFSSDTAPLLIALDAQFTFASSEGQRTLPLRELYRDDGVHHLTLEPGALILEILIPPHAEGFRAAHRKIAPRAAIDFPLANAGVAVTLDAQGVCRAAKIVIGAIHSAPVEIAEAESILIGHRLAPACIEQAASAASSAVTPMPNIGESVAYRKAMVKVLVQRALQELSA
jgi:4-hydroxybenzoyl-CoA reductase subunit beta